MYIKDCKISESNEEFFTFYARFKGSNKDFNTTFCTILETGQQENIYYWYSREYVMNSQNSNLYSQTIL